MTRSKDHTEKIFSFILTLGVIALLTTAVIPGVMGEPGVNLGSAGNYAVLSKSGITTTGTTLINGNIGASPIAASAITGFGLTMDPSKQFSHSSLVKGGVYAADYSSPTPYTMTIAVSNMEAAYTDAGGRANPVASDMYAGNLGGRTLVPGVYKWSSGVIIPSGSDLTLDGKGGSNAVWIFQVSGDLTMDSASRVVLINGANANNVYWQIAGPSGAVIGSGAHAEGNILTQKAITMNSGATLNGRALAQTAVTLIANTITPPTSTPAPVVQPTQYVDSTETPVPGATRNLLAPTRTATPGPTSTLPVRSTVTAYVSGDSAIYRTDVTGTGIERLVVAGTTVQGPGQGIGQAPGTVYQYVDLGPAQSVPLDHVAVSFAVPHSWMASNHLSSDNVILNRLDGNAWVAVPTTFVKTDGANDHFTAITPEFSRVAITGEFTTSTSTSFTPWITPVVVVAQPPVTQVTADAPGQLAPTQLPTQKSPVPAWVAVTAVMGTLMIMAVRSGPARKKSPL